MTNIYYVAVYILDIAALLIMLKFIFGYNFVNKINNYIFSFCIIVFHLAYLISLEDLSDRLFGGLLILLIIGSIMFNGNKIRLIGLSFLIYLSISAIDSLPFNLILLFFKGQHYNNIIIGKINFLCTVAGFISIILMSFALNKQKKFIHKYIETMTISVYLFYTVTILISGIVIGYAGVIAQRANVIKSVDVVGSISFSIFGILLIFFAISITIILDMKKTENFFMKEKEKYLADQIKQYEILNKKNDMLKSFRHDVNGHIQVLISLSEANEISNLKKYIHNLDEMKSACSYINTNNVVSDGILNEYFEKCQDENINFNVVGRFPDSINIPQIDLCVILYNSVKNAYEAACKCKTNKAIFIKISVYKHKIYINIKNSTDIVKEILNNSIQTDKKDYYSHGIGISNMEGAINKNGGHLKLYYDKENNFITDIMII